MNSVCKPSHFFPTICLATLLTGAVLLISASDAQAREAVAARGAGGRGFVAVRGGYNYGYGYGYSYPVSTTVNYGDGSSSSGSSLPSGYIATLPAGAAPVVVFGKTYYFANGNYYSPVFYGGSTVYMPANP